MAFIFHFGLELRCGYKRNSFLVILGTFNDA